MTMPTLVQICEGVQDIVGALAGIRIAPDVPTDQAVGGDVTAFCYPGIGTFELIAKGREKGTHTLHLYVITPRRNLRTDWARIIALGDTIPRALLGDVTLGGTTLHIAQIRYTYGQLEWGGQQELGWLFELEVFGAGSLA
jgi:hypothetical protein